MDKLDASGFHCSFSSVGKSGFDPRDWEKYFLNFSPSFWQEEGDGIVQFFDNAGHRFTLTIVYAPPDGFIVQFDERDLANDLTLQSVIGVKSDDQLDHFLKFGDDLQFPKGCVLEPSLAWLAIKGFLENPRAPARDVKWVNINDLDWPEC